jgi:E3 ubiquitin ligase SMURF1/2
MRGIEQQFLSLQKGFHELIPANLLRPFDERELELLIGGICKIDTADWQANTRLKVSNNFLVPIRPISKWMSVLSCSVFGIDNLGI